MIQQRQQQSFQYSQLTQEQEPTGRRQHLAVGRFLSLTLSYSTAEPTSSAHQQTSPSAASPSLPELPDSLSHHNINNYLEVESIALVISRLC